MANNFINYIKQKAMEHGISYKDALSTPAITEAYSNAPKQRATQATKRGRRTNNPTPLPSSSSNVNSFAKAPRQRVRKANVSSQAGKQKKMKMEYNITVTSNSPIKVNKSAGKLILSSSNPINVQQHQQVNNMNSSNNNDMMDIDDAEF